MLELIPLLLLAIGLSAACGFRVFLPPLVLGVLGHLGVIDLRPELAWLAGWPALTVLLTASAVESLAYFVPWLDHLLDVLMAPVAVIAGTLLSAALFDAYDPAVKWSLALIAGGGASALARSGSSGLRALSTVTTGGFANFLVAGAETVGAVGMTILAVMFPVLALMIIGTMVMAAIVLLRRVRRVGLARGR